MHTPATQHRRDHARMSFKDAPVGSTFECNGNLWTKRTERTAVGIWPAALPSWAYFKTNEAVYA